VRPPSFAISFNTMNVVACHLLTAGMGSSRKTKFQCTFSLWLCRWCLVSTFPTSVIPLSAYLIAISPRSHFASISNFRNRSPLQFTNSYTLPRGAMKISFLFHCSDRTGLACLQLNPY